MEKKSPLILLGLFLLGGVYNFWTLRPVEVLHVDSDAGGTVVVVVDHMPWTDKEKIDWYLSRREALQKKYPLYDNNWHSYYIADIGDGFTNYNKSPGEDLLCFSTLKNDDNCIIKKYFLIIDEFSYKNTRFYVSGDETAYQLTPDKKLEFVQHDEGWQQ